MSNLTKLFYVMDKRWLAGYFLLLLVGFGISARQPPFYSPDEGAHYLRAYEVSHFHLINSRGNVGTDIPCNEYITAAKKYQLTPAVQTKAEEGQSDPACIVKSINTAGTYSFIPYLPAAVSLRITESLEWAVESRLSAARFFNFLVWFSVLFAGIMCIDKGRFLMACIVLMPAYFWQLVALSADGALFASGMVYVCVVVSLIQRGGAIKPRSIQWLIALAMLIGASKGVYALMALFSFALWSQLPSHGWRYKIVALASPTVAALATFFLFAGVADSSQIYLGNGAAPTAQLMHVLQNPIAFTKVLWNTLWSIELEGSAVPRYAVANPSLGFDIALTVGLAIAVLIFRSDFGVSRRVRLLAIGLSGVAFASFCLPLYLTYTPVGFNAILGLQGRYYLPILPLIFVALAINAAKINWLLFRNKSSWIIILPLGSLVWACWSIK